MPPASSIATLFCGVFYQPFTWQTRWSFLTITTLNKYENDDDDDNLDDDDNGGDDDGDDGDDDDDDNDEGNEDNFTINKGDAIS